MDVYEGVIVHLNVDVHGDVGFHGVFRGTWVFMAMCEVIEM